MSVCPICCIQNTKCQKVRYVDQDRMIIRRFGIAEIWICSDCRRYIPEPVVIDTEAFSPPVKESHLVLSKMVIEAHRLSIDSSGN